MNPIRASIAAEVRRLFANPSGKRAVIPAAPGQGLFPADAISRQVHGDVTSMMIGGVSALLLQMLHPKALAGVWDHSNFRQDMAGRLRRTASFIAVTTYGAAADAESAICRVNRIHAQVGGTLPDGTAYAANDPHLLTFVAITEALSFLKAHLRYRDPLLSTRAQDRYFFEMAHVARRLGADPVPETRRGAEAFLRAIYPELRADARTLEVRRLLFAQVPERAAMVPFHALTLEAGVDLLPGWARRMHGVSGSGLRTPLVRAGAGGVGAVLRWALAAPVATPSGGSATGSG